jgi:hypothetical protein
VIGYMGHFKFGGRDRQWSPGKKASVSRGGICFRKGLYQFYICAFWDEHVSLWPRILRPLVFLGLDTNDFNIEHGCPYSLTTTNTFSGPEAFYIDYELLALVQRRGLAGNCSSCSWNPAPLQYSFEPRTISSTEPLGLSNYRPSAQDT